MSYSDLFKKELPLFKKHGGEIALTRNKGGNTITVFIGKHMHDFDYYDMINIFHRLNAVRNGTVDIEVIADNIIKFVNELVLLEQEVEIIN